MSAVLSEEDKKRIEEEERYRKEFEEKLKKEEEEKEYRDKVREKVDKEEEEKKRKGKGKGCLILIAIFVGLFIIGSLISAFGGGKEKPTPTPTPAQEEKKEKVISTPEVKGSELFEIAEYAKEMAEINTAVSEAMSKRSTLAFQWPNWADEDSISFAATGIILEDAYEKTKGLTPPEKMTSVHEKILKALKLYADSVPLANKGIDNLDASLIQKSASLIEEGTKWLNEATRELEAVASELY